MGEIDVSTCTHMYSVEDELHDNRVQIAKINHVAQGLKLIETQALPMINSKSQGYGTAPVIYVGGEKDRVVIPSNGLLLSKNWFLM